jgi:DNA (cytosine-5)-methyltransferase 1
MSGAGGCAAGYQQAGFYVVGVDIAPQPRYCGDEFVQADAFDVVIDRRFVSSFDAIHASPLCKAHTSMARLHPDREWPDQITPLRPLLEATGLPWVIENVPGAPLHDPVLICGSMFDPPMDVRRHRLFEANWPLRYPDWPCRHKLWSKRFPAEHRKTRGGMVRVVGVYGGGRYAGSDALRRQAMGIDWMRREELTQAIPPAYTEFIGQQMAAHLSHPSARDDTNTGKEPPCQSGPPPSSSPSQPS